MTPDSSGQRLSARRRRASAVGAALGALVAAGSVFGLPALDGALPGGAFSWQLAALALALASAWWAYRATASPDTRSGSARRLVRLGAAAAILLVVVWVGGVLVLWLLWPR